MNQERAVRTKINNPITYITNSTQWWFRVPNIFNGLLKFILLTMVVKIAILPQNIWFYDLNMAIP